MQHFVDIFQEYIVSEVHGRSWNSLVSELHKAQKIEDILAAHERFTDSILAKNFLEGKGKIVMDNGDLIF